MWFIAGVKLLLAANGFDDRQMLVEIAGQLERASRRLDDAEATAARRAARWIRNLLDPLYEPDQPHDM